jgi:hypothetical protein
MTEENSSPPEEVEVKEAVEAVTEMSPVTDTEAARPQGSQIDGMTNETAIAEKVDDQTPSKKKFKFPNLFVSEGKKIEISVDVVFDTETAEVYSITASNFLDKTAIEATEKLGVQTYNFKFSPVNYSQMSLYNKTSSFVDPNTGEIHVSKLGVRTFLLINHLKETDVTDENGEPIELIFDEVGNLETETYSKLCSTIPTLLEVVLSGFEKRNMINNES